MHNFDNGQRVQIAPATDLQEITERYDAGGPGWDEDMDAMLGQVGTVDTDHFLAEMYKTDPIHNYVLVRIGEKVEPHTSFFWRAEDLVALTDEPVDA